VRSPDLRALDDVILGHEVLDRSRCEDVVRVDEEDHLVGRAYAEQLGVPSSATGELELVQLFVGDAAELREPGPRGDPGAEARWPALDHLSEGRRDARPDRPAGNPRGGPRRDVLGDITGETGYVPLAQVAIDDHWTALRFRRRSEGAGPTKVAKKTHLSRPAH
jgi:hypothetical protein